MAKFEIEVEGRKIAIKGHVDDIIVDEDFVLSLSDILANSTGADEIGWDIGGEHDFTMYCTLADIERFGRELAD